jgi:protein TonB
MHTLPALSFSHFNLNKYIAIASVATLITFALFVGMHKLIANDQIKRPVETDYPTITLTQFKKDKPPTEKVRIKPKPIPLPTPKLTKKTIESTPDDKFDSTLFVSTIGSPIIKNKITPTFNSEGGDARPIVRVEPKYPSIAARDGIEGWVKLSFSITPSGAVNNIQVLDAEPKRTFNQAARRALSKWKYKPNIQDGKAQAQDGMMVMLDFKLAS